MKKSLTFVAALMMAFSATAAELNIYASGLRAGVTADDNTVEVQYVLNTPATSLEVQFLKDSEVSATVFITEAGLLTKGAHSATISLADVPGGEWHWAMKATGAANPAPDGEEDDPILEQVNPANDVRYIFYNPQGIAIDNSFESEWFGRMYVTESMDGDTDGMTETSRTQKRGVFVYDQLLEFVYPQNNVGYTGEVNFWNGRQGCRRPAVDAAGYVFMVDNNASTTGVWMMDPADPTSPFKEVLDLSKRGTIFTKTSAVCVEGTGSDRVLYAIDNMDGIVRFPIGEAATPYTLAPDTVIDSFVTYNIVNSEITMKRDNFGGFWLFQYRGQLDVYPMVVHYNNNGEVDFQMVQGMNEELAPSSAYRGAGAVSVDGKYMALGGAKTVNLYEVKYKASGEIKSVTRVLDYEFPNIGTNIDAIEFDVADNVFVASASSEYLHVFSLPKDDNSFVTPAAQRYTIESKSANAIDNISGQKVVKGVYDMTGRYLGETVDNLPKGVYIVGGEKVIK